MPSYYTSLIFHLKIALKLLAYYKSKLPSRTVNKSYFQQQCFVILVFLENISYVSSPSLSNYSFHCDETIALFLFTCAFSLVKSPPAGGLGGLKEKKVSSPSTRKTQYCGEPPCARGSVLGFRPPGFVFRILCLEGSVISLISPSSGGSPGPI